MTEIETTREASPPQPAPLAEPATAVEPVPSTGRLVGVDLARALAVFGMFCAHVGPRNSAFELDGWLLPLTEGRSSVLFATLAGFSLMLIAGRREPKTGLAGRQAKARIAIRAVILLALGTALALTAYGDIVILNFYGVYFLLALPLVRLRARTLAITAAVLAAVAPLLSFFVASLLSKSVVHGINAYDPLERISGIGVLDLLLTGLYPTVTWMPFVITGMALARLDLAAPAVQRRLAALGAALMTVGYGASWLASRLFSGFREVMAAQGDAFQGSGSGSGPGSGPGSGSGAPGPVSVIGKGPSGIGDWAWSMLTAEPHTGTTGEIVGSLGVAITVLICTTVLTARLPRLTRLAKPVIAAGTMSLSLYVAHLLAIPFVPIETYAALSGFLITAILFAGIWSRFFRRGPLEYLLHGATKPANLIR